MKSISRLFLVVVFILFITSCASIGQFINEAPSWIETPPEIVGGTTIVGRGSGSSPEEAKKSAVLNVLEKLGSENGIDYSDTYFRELYTTGKIKEFLTEETSKYSFQEEDIWYYYILTVSDTEKLNEARSKDYIEQKSRDEKILSLINQALLYYKDNKDVKAINSILEAISISLEGRTSKEEYGVESLFARVERYISQLSFEYLGKSKKTGGENGFKIYRKKGTLKPAVEEASVKIVYPSLSPDGTILMLSYLAQSDERGLVKAKLTNDYSLKKGVLTISINVDEKLLSDIKDKADSALYERIVALIDSTTFSTQYIEEPKYKNDEVVIAFDLYGEDEDVMDFNGAMEIIDALSSALSMTSPEIVKLEGEDEDEAFNNLKEKYGDRKTIFMVRIGIEDRSTNLDRYYTYTEGTIVKIGSGGESSEEYQTLHYAFAGDSQIDADRLALEYQIRITFLYLFGEF